MFCPSFSALDGLAKLLVQAPKTYEGIEQPKQTSPHRTSAVRTWMNGPCARTLELPLLPVLDKVKSLRKSWRQVSRQNVRDEIVKSPDIMVQCMAANRGNKFHA